MATIENDIAVARLLFDGPTGISVKVETTEDNKVLYTVTGPLSMVSTAAQRLDLIIEPETTNILSIELTDVETQMAQSVVQVSLGES